MPSSPAGRGAGGEGVNAALEQARRFLEAGADILDVGGESTRPGSQTVSAAEELERILPVVRALKQEFPEAVISVDTYKSEVAQVALRHEGVDWLHIPMNEVPARLEELEAGRAIVCYCHHGVRSLQVVAFLSARGFDSV